MNVIDVVKFVDQRKSERPSHRPSRANGKRVRAVQDESETTDAFLTHLRDMLTGPYQRISEARFDEMLDILSEQDDYARTKFTTIEAGLDDVVAETGFLREKYDALNERIELVIERAESERQATRAAFEVELAKLREEFEAKSVILADTLQRSMKETELETRRALDGLSTAVQDNKRESARLFEQAQTSSLNSLEARIAQWRAEIEDERKEDMSEVAAAMMDIGQRMMAQRRSPV